jgi:hypothetical protein
MDDKTKKLLGSATVAVASLGLATLPGFGAPSDEAVTLSGLPGASGPVVESDLLVELMLRTGGSQSVEAINRELRQMLSYMSEERYAELPTLIWGLRSLGLSSETQSEIFASLIDQLAAIDVPLDEPLVEQLAEALVGDAERAILAEPVLLEPDPTPVQPTARGVGLYEG